MKSFLVKYLAFACLLLGALVAREASAADGDGEKAAVRASEQWLAVLDAGNYAEGWMGAAESLRTEIGQKQWTRQVRRRREAFGAVQSRTVAIAGVWYGDPDSFGGEYSFVRFKTAFVAGKTAAETITAARERDGQWKVTNYLLTAPWPGRRRILKALLLVLVIIWVWYRELKPQYI